MELLIHYVEPYFHDMRNQKDAPEEPDLCKSKCIKK